MCRLLMQMMFIFSVTMLSNLCSAEVGPLTARYQEMINTSGGYTLKYNDYNDIDLLLMSGCEDYKREPSSVVYVAQYEDNRFNETTGMGINKSKGISRTIEKNNKFYRLDMQCKKGVYIPLSTNNRNFEENYWYYRFNLPTALSFLVPDRLKNRMMYSEAQVYKYKGSYDEVIDGVVYQCEEYGVNMPQLKRSYKLFFLDTRIVKYAHGNRLAEVIEFSNSVPINVFDIPKGFKIYSGSIHNFDGTNGDIDDLLSRKLKLVEKY